MAKKFQMTLLIIGLVFLLAACGTKDVNGDGNLDNNVENESPDQTELNDDNSTENEENKDNVGNNENESKEKEDAAKSEEDMKGLFAELGYTKVEIEIEYDNDEEFEIEIKERKDGSMKAKVEDEINDIEIKEVLEAFNYLYPYIKELNITDAEPREEVIETVLRVFGMDEDYEKFEAEFKFTDGSSIEYEHKR